MAQKRNKHTNTGHGVETPLDSIHLGTGRFIRMESDLPEDATGDKRVGRRSYNDQRYIRTAISYTFSELDALATAGTLKSGQSYLITDFATIHRINGTSAINTGTTEPLVVIAKSTTQFESRAISTLFPKDIIEYDFTSKLCEDGTTPRKGKINFRWEVEKDTYTHYDFRQVRFRRFKVLSKQEEAITSLTSNTLDCLLTFTTGTNLSGTYFVVNRRIHVNIGAITHDAGSLTITVRKGTGTFTKPLLKHDGTAWTANELANTSGILTNCLERDAFVLMNYRTFGKEIVGTYSSPISTTWSIGDGMSYLVDAADFQDYLTFQGTYFGVHIDKYNNAVIGNNIVFLGNNRDCKVGTNSFNLTVRGQVINAVFGPETQNSLWHSDVLWSNFDRECVTSYFGYCRHFTAKDHIINCTIYPPTFHFVLSSTPSQSTFACSGNMVAFYSPFLENSGFFLSGSGGGDGRTGAVFIGVVLNSLVGWFSANDLIVSKELRSTSLYEKIANSYISSLNLKTLPSSVGAVVPLGRDSKGNVVESTGSGISIAEVPATLTSAGLVGQIASDADFTYIYVGDNTTHLWDRIAKDTSNWSTV